MSLKDYSTKDSLVIVYTGEGKGKTSASLGLMTRALGTGWRVSYIQFIKHWEVGEHKFIKSIQPIYPSELTLYKGGKGFYEAGDMSAKNVTEAQHVEAAQQTLEFSLECAASGDYDLVICDEINNAVHDGLVDENALELLIDKKHPKTNLCLTGRNFPDRLLDRVDIATDMSKLKHHFDDKFLANKGIDY